MPIDSTPLPLGSLPGFVAGPVLRRLTRTEVSVWVAAVEPDPITLRVSRRGPAGPAPTTATLQPAKVGANLWMAVLTAGAPGGAFEAGQIYEYELTAPWESTPSRRTDWAALSLPPATRPTFLAPPATAVELVVHHTSCRKPHGGGRDGLALALEDLATRFSGSRQPQPHLLVLSGDQIYADEVGHPLMPRVLRVAKDLIGVDETDVFGSPPPIGGRGPGTTALGYTGATANHLWSYSEFLAMYLLAWSPVLWPATLPPFPTNPVLGPPDVDPDVSEESWDEELINVGLFRTALPAVRRVLANVPSLMIFDDHEITDDWNIDHPWVNSVYGKAAGRRAVTNGLLAYALCQHWGNRPAAFATPGITGAPRARRGGDGHVRRHPGQPGHGLRAAAGGPGGSPADAPPSQVLRDLSSPGAIRYDLTLGPDEGWPVRIVLLDERTVREDRGRTVGAPASRSPRSAAQLPAPPSPVPFTIVVAAAPILGSELVEDVIQPLLELLLPSGARFADFESWSAARANHQDLLARLAAHDPVVVLSGDVHYGFTSSMTRTEGGAHHARSRSSPRRRPRTWRSRTPPSACSASSRCVWGWSASREFSGFASLSNADKTKLLSAPPPGAELPWDDTVDVLLGRVAREGASVPTAIATPVATAYGLAAPGWRYEVEPVDDPMADFAAAPVDAAVAGLGSRQVAADGRGPPGRRTWSAWPGCSSASRSSPS